MAKIIDNKYYKMLELDKIIDIIISKADLDESKNRLSELELENDIDLLRHKLSEVNEAVIILARMGKFPLYFSCNIAYNLSKIHKNGTISLVELAQIGNFIDSVRDLILFCEKLDDNKIDCELLKDHLNLIEYPKDLNLHIKKIVTPYGEIKDDASATLRQIRKQYSDLEHSIQSKIQEILSKNSSKLSQATISMRNDRYVLPVKSEYKNQIKGIIHDESSSGETTFIEPIVICEMNNKMAALKEEEKREIERIIKAISLEIDSYYDALIADYEELVYLDIVFAKARYAKEIDARMPSINNDGIVEMYNCYHPLLNVDHVVKNNIIIGKEYKGIIITGPNTGGKTVLLKTIGLLGLMLKCGMLIPCDDNSNINIFDNIFSDIGDEQSINQNLSTFSSHIKNVIDIIDNVNNNSLILLDELGSGTDPVEGSSLAISIFDYLISKNSLLVATSHYSELKIHAYNSDTIINASVEFDSNTLKPTYRLLIGVPGMSNAINVSRNLGLKKEILDAAKDYVYKKNDNINNVLDKMVKQSNLLDKKIQEVQEEKKALEALLEEKNNEIKKTIEERNKIIRDANKEKEKIISSSIEQINDLLEEVKALKSKNIKGHEISDLKHKIRELDNNQLEEEVFKEDLELKEGSKVYIKSYKTYGTVLKLKKEKCEVNVGVVSMMIDNDDLVVVRDTDPNNISTNDKQKEKNTVSINKKASSKLDLRGMRYEDAKDAIYKYIDDCVYCNMPSATIIHGFGSGTIRKLVQEIVSKNPNIAEYRYGGEHEGGSGATVVTFKN